MRRIVFVFVAALVTLLGVVREAQAAVYEIVSGDTLSEIAEKPEVCGGVSHMNHLAAANGIEAPEYKIYAGGKLNVVCKQVAPLVENDLSVKHYAVAALAPELVVLAEEVVFDEGEQEVAQDTPIQPALTDSGETGERESFLREGTYVSLAPAREYREGDHEAVIRFRTDAQGNPVYAVTQITVLKSAGETFLRITFEEDLFVGENFTVAFLDANSQVVTLGYSDLAGRRVGSSKQLPVVKKPSLVAKVWRLTKRYSMTAASVAVGAYTGGTSWAILAVIPTVQREVAQKVQDKYNKAAELNRRAEEGGE